MTNAIALYLASYLEHHAISAAKMMKLIVNNYSTSSITICELYNIIEEPFRAKSS